MNGITQLQFKTLEELFDYYNAELFGNQLQPCIVNLSRHRNAAGFFIFENWQSVKKGDKKHEISINPDTLSMGSEYWHSTLVHEMVHQWQYEYGKPSRYSYHNKEFAQKMKEIGLQPSSTGKPGGAETGQSMDHYQIEGGKFLIAFRRISTANLEALQLPYLNAKKVIHGFDDSTEEDTEQEETSEPKGKSKSGKKIKYMCPCGCKVWGKSGLELFCKICQADFTCDPDDVSIGLD